MKYRNDNLIASLTY